MTKQILSVLTVLLVSPLLLFSQNNYDDITVMHYNLLNYRNSTSYCTASNNSTGTKEDGLKTIIQYKDPDIVTFNEVGSAINNIARLDQNVMNVDGVTKYAYTDYQATNGSDLMNVIFYNNEVLEVYSKTSITQNLDNTHIVRLIDVTTFYHKDPVLEQTLDTNFLTVFTAHLKAGNTTADRGDRAKATAAIMNYISNHPEIENYILTGDLNTYNGNHDPFQNLVGSSAADSRFYDPMQMVGNWNNSASFSYVHTQSTRSVSNGCFSGSGLDDRFDFILINGSIRNDENRIEYIDGSYEALGQDGNRFNGAIDDPANNSEPTDIIQALYNVSDHLPIFLDLRMTYSAPVGINDQDLSSFSVRAKQPSSGQLALLPKGSGNTQGSIRIYNILGQTVFNSEHIEFTDGTWINIPVENLPQGVLIIQTQLNNGLSNTLKIVKS